MISSAPESAKDWILCSQVKSHKIEIIQIPNTFLVFWYVLLLRESFQYLNTDWYEILLDMPGNIVKYQNSLNNLMRSKR